MGYDERRLKEDVWQAYYLMMLRWNVLTVNQIGYADLSRISEYMKQIDSGQLNLPALLRVIVNRNNEMLAAIGTELPELMQ